jgi:peptidoglycan/LPS O-acetylase OafA/YrhL
MTPRADRFPLFDSLRALAALAVLAFHAAFFAGATEKRTTLGLYASHLDVGVTVFFLISGFLLYRPFVKARLRGEEAPGTAAYAWRRFLRIVPAYWVALTVVAIWLGRDEVFSASGIPTFYGFAQIYDAENSVSGIGQAWTLCVEVTFYAFLPLWALAMRALPARDPERKLAWELAGLALLVLLSGAYKVWALRQVGPTELSSGPYLMPLPNFLDQFALGMGLAVLSVWYEGRERLPGPLELIRRRPGLAWLGATLAFWFVCTRIGFTGEFLQQYSVRMFLGRHVLYAVVALCIVLPAVFSEPGRGVVGRLLANRALVYVGLVSYAVYLYHYAVIDQVDAWLGGLDGASVGIRFGVYALLGTGGAVLLASASYYAIERPALRLKRLVGRMPESALGEATTETAPKAPPISGAGGASGV